MELATPRGGATWEGEVGTAADEGEEEEEEEGEEEGDAAAARQQQDNNGAELDLRFPYNRVKKIVQEDQELQGTFRKESLQLIAKAAELFVLYLTQQAHANTQLAGRKMVKPEDIQKAVDEIDILEFLKPSLGSKQ